jgi:hypothetical protein
MTSGERVAPTTARTLIIGSSTGHPAKRPTSQFTPSACLRDRLTGGADRARESVGRTPRGVTGPRLLSLAPAMARYAR